MNLLATKMNNGVKKGRFDSANWEERKKARHLKELRKQGIEYSQYYKCATEAKESPNGLKDRKKRQEERTRRYASKQKAS